MSVIFAFSACNKPEDTEQSTTSTTSVSNVETTTQKDETTSSEATTNADSGNLIGTWAFDETVSPKVFYTDFYNTEITKTNIKMRTTYKFEKNGTFSTAVTIVNLSEIRKEYRALMVEGARIKLESQGKMLTTDDVLYYEKYADSVLDSIGKVQKGSYKVEDNKIIYTISGESYYETFTLNGNKLTLTGSSNSSEGYPVTMTKR